MNSEVRLPNFSCDKSIDVVISTFRYFLSVLVIFFSNMLYVNSSAFSLLELCLLIFVDTQKILEFTM